MDEKELESIYESWIMIVIALYFLFADIYITTLYFCFTKAQDEIFWIDI